MYHKCKLQWFLKLVWRHFKANNGHPRYTKGGWISCSLLNMDKDNLKITLKIRALNLRITGITPQVSKSPEDHPEITEDHPKIAEDFTTLLEDLVNFSRTFQVLWPTYTLPKTLNSIFCKVLETSNHNYFCAIWKKHINFWNTSSCIPLRAFTVLLALEIFTWAYLCQIAVEIFRFIHTSKASKVEQNIRLSLVQSMLHDTWLTSSCVASRPYAMLPAIVVANKTGSWLTRAIFRLMQNRSSSPKFVSPKSQIPNKSHHDPQIDSKLPCKNNIDRHSLIILNTCLSFLEKIVEIGINHCCGTWTY